MQLILSVKAGFVLFLIDLFLIDHQRFHTNDQNTKRNKVAMTDEANNINDCHYFYKIMQFIILQSCKKTTEMVLFHD